MHKEWKWNLELGKIASIWKAGCIIRAVFLDRITDAYKKNPDLANLLLYPDFKKDVESSLDAWRRVVVVSLMVLHCTSKFFKIKLFGSKSFGSLEKLKPKNCWDSISLVGFKDIGNFGTNNKALIYPLEQFYK